MGREDLKGHPSRVISGDCGCPEKGSLSLSRALRGSLTRRLRIEAAGGIQ